MIECLLYERAKSLGNKRGFLMADKCPLGEIRDNCDGKVCVYLATLGHEIPEDVAFNEERREDLEDRIEDCTPDDTVRLTNLREEIRKLTRH